MGRKTNEQYELEQRLPDRLETYKKSNTLINSKGRSALFSQKLFALGIQHAVLDKKTNTLETTIYGTDLKRYLGDTSHSLYERVKALTLPNASVPTLMDWRIIYMDDDDEEIQVINVIQDAHFRDGILKIRYNSGLTKHLIDLKSGYTTLSIKETLHLNSQYSFRMYEILKSQLDYFRAVKKKSGQVTWEIALADFKLRIGVIDPQKHPDIVSELETPTPDYDKIEAMIESSKDVRYKDASNFSKRVLIPATKELNEKTSLVVDYTLQRSGRGGKIRGIIFTIDSKDSKGSQTAKTKQEKLSAEEREDILDEITDTIEEKLKRKDIRAIAEAADFNLKKVSAAYALAKKQTHIDNLPGWLIKAIQEGYTETVKVNKYSFLEFEQHDYDFDILEESVIEK